MSSWDDGQAALVEGDLGKALPFLRQAAEEAEGLPNGSDEKCERLTLLASALARQGQIEQAEAVFARVLKERIEASGMDPTVAATLYLLAEIYRYDPRRMLDAAGILAVASEILERYEVKSELTFQVEYANAVLLSQLMNTQGALDHLAKAWPLIPADSPLLFNMLGLAASLGVGAREYDFAAQVFAKTIALQEPGPDQNSTLAALADIQLIQGQFQEAFDTTARGLTTDPNDGNLLRRHGVAASRLGREQEATESLLSARQRAHFQNDRAELTKILGDVQARQQRWERAVELYEEARALVKLDPYLRAQIRVALGHAYRKLGKTVEARRNFAAGAALRKHSQHPPYTLMAEALLNLGQVHIEQGNFFRAELRLLEALDMLDRDKSPFELQPPPEQARVTQLLSDLPLALTDAMEKQERWAHAASMLEPLVIQLGGPVESIDRLCSLYERAEMPDRVEFWAKVANEMRAEDGS